MCSYQIHRKEETENEANMLVFVYSARKQHPPVQGAVHDLESSHQATYNSLQMQQWHPVG